MSSKPTLGDYGYNHKPRDRSKSSRNSLRSEPVVEPANKPVVEPVKKKKETRGRKRRTDVAPPASTPVVTSATEVVNNESTPAGAPVLAVEETKIAVSPVSPVSPPFVAPNAQEAQMQFSPSSVYISPESGSLECKEELQKPAVEQPILVESQPNSEAEFLEAQAIFQARIKAAEADQKLSRARLAILSPKPSPQTQPIETNDEYFESIGEKVEEKKIPDVQVYVDQTVLAPSTQALSPLCAFMRSTHTTSTVTSLAEEVLDAFKLQPDSVPKVDSYPSPVAEPAYGQRLYLQKGAVFQDLTHQHSYFPVLPGFPGVKLRAYLDPMNDRSYELTLIGLNANDLSKEVFFAQVDFHKRVVFAPSESAEDQQMMVTKGNWQVDNFEFSDLFDKPDSKRKKFDYLSMCSWMPYNGHVTKEHSYLKFNGKTGECQIKFQAERKGRRHNVVVLRFHFGVMPNYA